MTPQAGLQRLAPAVCTYLGGLVIGLTLVSFPASSVVLRELHHFSNEQYGGIYIPQLIAAVAGALLGGMVERRYSLRAMFLVALSCYCAAELLLALSSKVAPGPALALVMVGTASFGFGFGFGGGPLNAFAAMLFPDRQGPAVTALHMCAGAGLTIAPVFFAALADRGIWIAGPLLLAATSALIFVVALVSRFPEPQRTSGRTSVRREDHPGTTWFFWVCALAAMLYSIAEGTFSNWATIFLTEERGFNAGDAAVALTCFWAALTAGRLAAAVLSVRLPPLLFLIALPCVMVLGFLLLPQIGSQVTANMGFGFAGLACSAFFPMLVAFTAWQNPQAISWIASMLTAAMMVGVGIGSYAVGALRGGTPIAELYVLAIIVPLGCLFCVIVAQRLRTRYA